MNAKLTRFRSTSKGTFGRLDIGGVSLYTLEREWNNNKSNVSCIPAGDYVMVHHESPRFGACLCVLNEGAGVVRSKREDEAVRWGILIHPANKVDELAGCIAPAMSFDDNQVYSSRMAFNEVMDITEGCDAITLEIEWGKVE